MLSIRSDKDIQNAALSEDSLKSMIAQRTGNGDALSTMRTAVDNTESSNFKIQFIYLIIIDFFAPN